MRSIQLLSILCLLPLVFSCSTDESSSDKSKQTVRLSVSTPSVSENEGNTELTRSGSEASASQTVTVSAGNGMSLEATLERSPQPVTRATTSLSTGVKYRVIAFKEDDVSTSGYLSYADFTVGTTGSTGGDLHVPAGSTYTFVCYSLGTTTLPVFSQSSLNITANPATDDLLYTKFNQSITESSKTLSFSFKHQFSQVTVIADATAMGKNITAISSSLSPNYSGTLNLSTGTLTAGTEAARSIPWGTITAGQTVTAGACPVFTNGSSSVTVSIPSVTIDGTTKTNLTATFGSGTMQTGYKYILKLKFKWYEGPVAVGLTWAPGNLFYSGGTYYFAPTQDYYSGGYASGDYWNWCVLSPTDEISYGSSYDYATNDPCRLVVPVGTWRMPTLADFTALSNTGSIWTTNKNGVNGKYFGTTDAAIANANPNNYVFLPTAGLRPYGGGTTYDVGSYGNYWSSTLDGATSRAYILNTFGGTEQRRRDYGFSIRCVK